jgi:hypothetical protein
MPGLSPGVEDIRGRFSSRSAASLVPRGEFGGVVWMTTPLLCTTAMPTRATVLRGWPRWVPPATAWPSPLGLASTPRGRPPLPAPFGLVLPRWPLTVLSTLRLSTRSRSYPAGACAVSSPRSGGLTTGTLVGLGISVVSPQRPLPAPPRPRVRLLAMRGRLPPSRLGGRA